MSTETLPNNTNQEINSVLGNLVKDTEDEFFQIANSYDEVSQSLESDPENQDLIKKETKLRDYLEKVSELNKKYIGEIADNNDPTKRKIGSLATDDIYNLPADEAKQDDRQYIDSQGFIHSSAKEAVDSDTEDHSFGR